jgi:putative oxidoreductase
MMINHLLQTDRDYVCLFLRIVAGIIIFPYGMQKLLGWFDNLGGGTGIKGAIEQLRLKKIPLLIAWLIIIG